MRPVTLGIHSTTRRTCTIPTIAIAVSLFGIAGPARAQGGTGVLVGAVHDSANAAISGARVDVPGTAVGVVTSPNGSFRLVNIPAGPRTVVVHRLGFAPDSARVEIPAGGTVVHNFVLAPAAVNLANMVVRASPRMAETKAGALAIEQNAPNIVSALSGDEMRSRGASPMAAASDRMDGWDSCSAVRRSGTTVPSMTSSRHGESSVVPPRPRNGACATIATAASATASAATWITASMPTVSC